MMSYNDTKMETHSGRIVDVWRTDPETIHLPDVAWHLSRIARFNGATLGPVYSVAQHSLFVAVLVQQFYRVDDPVVVLQALLHDAHEAYLGDILTPVKNIPGMRAVLYRAEAQLIDVMHEALGVPPPWGGNVDVIRQADHLALAIEAWHLVHSRGATWQGARNIHPKAMGLFVAPRPSDQTHDAFLEMFGRLERALNPSRVSNACGV